MKKLMILAAGMMLAVGANAATVGWSLGGAAAYAGDAYQFFVIGQKGATDIATITTLLDAGTSTAGYALGSGVIGSAGSVLQSPAGSGQTLGAGTYTAFFVVFDDATPKAGESKYVVVSGQTGMTKEIASTTANVSFGAGNVSSIVGDASNWKTYGEPEPTSALMMLFGLAGLALRRKRA